MAERLDTTPIQDISECTRSGHAQATQCHTEADKAEHESPSAMEKLTANQETRETEDIAMGTPYSNEGDEPLDLRVRKTEPESQFGQALGREIPDNNNTYFLGGGFITLDRYPARDASTTPKNEEETPIEVQKEELPSSGTTAATSEEGELTDSDSAWGVVTTRQPRDNTPDSWVDASDAPWETTASSPDPENQPDSRIAQLIRREGATLAPAPSWMLKNRGYSVQILHDGLLLFWPNSSDQKCSLQYKNDSISEWAKFIKSGRLRFRGHCVALVLNKLRDIEFESQLKNNIAILVRAIRQVVSDPDYKIYICNTIIGLGRSRVLGIRDKLHNQKLDDALTSIRISHGLTKVFLADINSVYPIGLGSSTACLETGRLTSLGCIHYRACLFRELGLSPYHVGQ